MIRRPIVHTISPDKKSGCPEDKSLPAKRSCFIYRSNYSNYLETLMFFKYRIIITLTDFWRLPDRREKRRNTLCVTGYRLRLNMPYRV
jgi:hypothetical protein